MSESKKGVLVVTTTESVDIGDRARAQYIAALINEKGDGPYTEAGWSLTDIGNVTAEYHAEVPE